MGECRHTLPEQGSLNSKSQSVCFCWFSGGVIGQEPNLGGKGSVRGCHAHGAPRPHHGLKSYHFFKF